MGEKHIFLRFENCNIRCGYCDELGKPATDLSVNEILEQVKQLEHEKGPHSFVSLTGGEPLFYHSFLKEICPELKKVKFRLYLETNGILWKQLSEVIDWVDVIAMDMKPASVTEEKNYFEEHRKFLEIAQTKETFIKIVVSKNIDQSEFIQLCRIIHETAPETPLILQPVSSQIGEGHDDPELMQVLTNLQTIGSKLVSRVRILPRLHKILNIR